MATWEDGPEYAPVERPAEYLEPDAAPLDDAPPRSLRTDDIPAARPDLQPPDQPLAGLETLAAHDHDEQRDPSEPFQVVQAVMTDSTSAWSAARSTVLTSPVQQHWAPPSGAPVVAPTGDRASADSANSADPLGSGRRSILTPPPNQPIQLSGQPSPTGAFPTTGSTEWFGPGPRPDEPEPEPITLGGFLAALTPFVLISLLIGGLIPPISPLVFVVAFALSSRITVAGEGVRRAFAGGALVVSLVAVVTIFTGPGIGEWWSTVGLTSLVVCWAVLLISAVLVLRALQSGVPVPGGREQARRNTWA
ncbi:MAG TPA: hypothetical protein VK103_00165 [Bacillota bacterium]|nr:hypothetical protein [Bacillota bacterium]